MGSMINKLFYFKPKFSQEIDLKKKKKIHEKLYVYDKSKRQVDIENDIDINEKLLKNKL